MNVKSPDSDRTNAAPRRVQQERVMYRVGVGTVIAAVGLGAAFGCNSVLGIGDATLCGGGSCDGGVPTVVTEGTPASLPAAGNPPAPGGVDAAVPPASPLGSGELGTPADVPLAPNENPAENSGAGSGSNNSGAGNGSGNGNSGGNPGNGNASGPGEDDPPPDDAPTTPPPTTPPPTTPPPTQPPPPPSPCDGRDNGEAFCSGLNRIACGPGGSVTSTLPCSSAEHCAQATGPLCAVCLTGEASCSGAALSVCNATHTAFDIQACAGPQFCNAAQARCTPPACQPNEVRCDGALLQVCNATLTGFDPIADCGVATACNASTASCTLFCTPGTSRCVDLTTVATCDATGQTEVVSGCPLLQTCESGDCQLLGGL